ncbi:MAG TPA: hypothetical protein VMT30_09215 [Candidatus Saccharimonadia bacterium]|nr:hypothetical protein [Candidatus Saccharimonadia bacterium]
MAEYTNRHNIVGEAIPELFTKHNGRYTGSHGRISDARSLLIGEMKAPLPDVLAKREDCEAFRVDTAQKYTSVMQLLNKLAGTETKDEPELKRPKLGTSDLHERNSSRIERFSNPSVSRSLSHRDLTELALVEAEGCAIEVPEVARFARVPGHYYEDDKAERIKPEFRRNAQGHEYQDALDTAKDEQGDDFDEEKFDADFGTDEKQSRRAYDRHVKALRARNFPSDTQLLSRLQYVPINPLIKGPDVTVDGIISRTRMAPSDAMRRNYIIDGLHDHLEPKDTTEGDMETGDLWLYQAWLTDQDADGNLYPYVAYSLAGKHTRVERPGFEDAAVIDLYKQCGLRTLPVVPFYGWRWFSTDPDKRAMPYTFPFGRSWLAGDAFLTGKAYAGWSEGMLAWFMQMPDSVRDTAMQQAWMEFVKQNPLTIEPFKITPVWGTMIPAQHPGSGRDVNEMIGALNGSNSQDLVSPLARGGGDAGSAIERSVVSADTLAGVSDIRRSVLNVWRRVGELKLEVCCGVSRKTGKNVVVLGNPETPSDGGSVTRALIELDPRWLGPEGEESFDLEASYPQNLGDDLAAKAQLFGFWEKDAITDEDWCQAIGVKDPDRYMAQLLYQRWKKTPPALQIIMKDAAEYLGDKELVALFGAQQSGAAGQQGEPIGMTAGLNPPMGGSSDPGAQAATGMQNPANSQYAAIAAAGRQASVGGLQQPVQGAPV